MNKKEIIILILILCLGVFLRVWNLNSVPMSLFGDEIDVGLQANSILHTGKDYYSNPFPTMFHTFNEYRLPLFIYSAVPFVATFGLNEWGVRLTGAFWGVVGLVAIFLFTRKLINTRVALIATFFLCISPWHLHYSRQGGIESGLLFAVFTLGLWAFLKGLEKYRWLVVSAILFTLTIYTYAIAPVLLTCFGIFALIKYRRVLFGYGLKKLSLIIILCLILAFPFIKLYLGGEATHRTGEVSIFTSKELNDEIVKRRVRESDHFDAIIWHNKPFAFTEEIMVNYIRALSPEFLFLKGDPNLRHSVVDRGEFYLFQMGLITLGIVFLVRIKKKDNLILLAALIIISPIPSSITIGGGSHASRLIILLLPLTVVAAYGLLALINNFSKVWAKCLVGVLLILALINIPTYFHRYYNDWNVEGWRFWQYGYKEAMNYIKENDSKYSRIYFNNTYEPTLSRFLFYYNYDPKTFQQQFDGDWIRTDVEEGFDGFKLGDKYYFGTIESGKDPYTGLDELLKKDQLYLVSVRDEANLADWRLDPPTNFVLLKTIVNPFNEPIFYVISKK